MTGHSIFAHSRASPCEGFCLIIIKYTLSEYLQNKSAQILCPLIIWEKKLWIISPAVKYLTRKVHFDERTAGTYASKPLERRICVWRVSNAKIKISMFSGSLMRSQRSPGKRREAFVAYMPAVNLIYYINSQVISDNDRTWCLSGFILQIFRQ